MSDDARPPWWPARLARRLFAIDVRALAAFRIGLALVVLCDLVTRARDLEAHYADSGVLPRSVLLAAFPDVPLSFHLLNGTVWFQAGLFLLASLAALALLVGYRTRLATAATWLLLLSLQERAPLVLHSGDEILRLLLFWSVFLPLGALASVDRALEPWRKPLPERIVSIGTAVLLLQIAAVYFFTGLLKTGPDWWSEGDAVENALRLGSFVRGLGELLLSFPMVLRPLTRFVLALELVGPLLLFVPFATAAFRVVAVALFCVLQIGLGSTLALGGFPWVMTVAMLPFVPTAVWQRLFALPLLADSTSSVGKLGPLARASCGLLAVTALASNLASVGAEIPFPQPVARLGALLRIEQSWGMFTPYPARSDGWLVFPARLLDGSEIDLFHDAPVDWTRPASVSATYRNTRWRKYFLNLTEPRHARLRPFLLRHLCRRWNRQHRDLRRARSVGADFMLDHVLPGIGRSAPWKEPLGEVECRPGAGRFD